jgi:hypothetical protein
MAKNDRESGKDAARLSRIVASVVGPHRFSRYRWVVPEGNHPSGWHYGILRETKSKGSLQVDMNTVDPPLRRLVSSLHARQVKTLPSCAGHHGRTPGRVQVAAQDLQRQERAIQTQGLVVTDVEDGSTYNMLDPDWKSPSLGQLLAGVRHWEGVGYAGVVLPAGALVKAPAVSVRGTKVQAVSGSQQDLLHLWVQTPDPESQDRAWNDLSDQVLEYIESGLGRAV